MHRVGSLIAFVGGGIGRVALSGVLIGLFITIFGVLPWEIFAYIFASPPNPWTGPALVVIGLALIAASLWFNIWSLKQRAIDALAEDMS